MRPPDPVHVGGPTPRARRLLGPPWLLLALGLSTLPGCREITAPPVVAAIPADPGPILVLGIDGQPQSGARVTLNDIEYVEEDEYVEWQGQTDSAGFMVPDLPVGRYDVRIVPAGRQEPDWEQLSVRLREVQQTFDPRPRVQYGKLFVPEGFPTGRVDIEFITTSPAEDRRWNSSVRERVDPDGDFRIIWPVEAEYSVRLRGSLLWLDLDDRYALPHDGAIQIGFEAFRLDVVLTLGGADLPIGTVRIRAEVEDGSTEEELLIDGGSATIWALPGPGTLKILPGKGMPFLPRSVYHDFREGNVPTIELGDHLVEFVFVSASGESVIGSGLRLFDAETEDSRTFSGLGSRFSMFLRSGQYAVRASHQGFDSTDMAFDVDQAETLTIVMRREPG